ncbi:unnamed protein product [Notodromas monacha]|uniref:Uncharacterized protein n=1 Tax=Notodromas monacha TaxID=399045 RepID=A0A7R9BX46_9CRUS|nr:unnamed protein product [Notodromas monacha]CAG0923415.1 unnamed protein product [Notodromas monacha]
MIVVFSEKRLVRHLLALVVILDLIFVVVGKPQNDAEPDGYDPSAGGDDEGSQVYEHPNLPDSLHKPRPSGISPKLMLENDVEETAKNRLSCYVCDTGSSSAGSNNVDACCDDVRVDQIFVSDGSVDQQLFCYTLFVDKTKAKVQTRGLMLSNEAVIGCVQHLNGQEICLCDADNCNSEPVSTGAKCPGAIPYNYNPHQYPESGNYVPGMDAEPVPGTAGGADDDEHHQHQQDMVDSNRTSVVSASKSSNDAVSMKLTTNGNGFSVAVVGVSAMFSWLLARDFRGLVI